jgi:nitrate reductase cytochrome c-type subunit
MRKFAVAMLALVIAAGTGSLLADPLGSGLRGSTPLNNEGPAPPMTPMRNTAEKEVRNYPEQPPVIPHSIDGYQIDLNSNKCLSCHARAPPNRRRRWSRSRISWTATGSSSPQSRHAASSAPNATCRRA